MDTPSVAYVLCRMEDDSSLALISEHQDIVAGVAAGKHRVEVEDFDFPYGLYADGGRGRALLRVGQVIVSGHAGTAG